VATPESARKDPPPRRRTSRNCVSSADCGHLDRLVRNRVQGGRPCDGRNSGSLSPRSTGRYALRRRRSDRSRSREEGPDRWGGRRASARGRGEDRRRRPARRMAEMREVAEDRADGKKLRPDHRRAGDRRDRARRAADGRRCGRLEPLRGLALPARERFPLRRMLSRESGRSSQKRCRQPPLAGIPLIACVHNYRQISLRASDLSPYV
jgi:hypothetical protein